MANQGGGCKVCGCRHTSVIRTREKTIKWRGKQLTKVRRWRRCRHCLHEWTTMELDEDEVDEALKSFEDSDIPEIPELEGEMPFG